MHAAFDPPRVLFVDDDALITRFYRTALERHSVVVDAVAAGLPAIQRARSARYDAVICDVALPDVDGVEVLRAIRADDPHVPVLLLTGNASVASAAAAVEMGALRYLIKPQEPGALATAVHEAVALGRLARVNGEVLRILRQPDENFDRQSMESAFDAALETLWCATQPIVDPNSRTIRAWELLSRVDHPAIPNVLALVSAAERTGRIFALGRAVRRRAARVAAGLPEGADLFVNVHPADLGDPDLYDDGQPLSAVAHRVVLEVTERGLNVEQDHLRSRCEQLRGMGYRLAVDDLGAGYAGLTSFVLLRPEIVKLDMSLVRGVDACPLRQRVVGALVEVCRDIGTAVVAEGVETAAERDALVRLHCNLLQGYLFARPARADDAPPAALLPDCWPDLDA